MSLFRCPACGKGRLFHGLLTVADKCEACGLSFAGHEQGDGPAVFAILLVGALAAIGATIVEIKYEPPFWLHAIIWVPFVVIGSILALRFLKAMLIAVQYRVKREDFSNKP